MKNDATLTTGHPFLHGDPEKRINRFAFQSKKKGGCQTFRVLNVQVSIPQGGDLRTAGRRVLEKALVSEERLVVLRRHGKSW